MPLLAAALLTLPQIGLAQMKTSSTEQHPYVGMWVTRDGHIRHELLPNGRHVVNGLHIDYWDDTGFTADGTFVSIDELCHGGMIFYREKPVR